MDILRRYRPAQVSHEPEGDLKSMCHHAELAPQSAISFAYLQNNLSQGYAPEPGFRCRNAGYGRTYRCTRLIRKWKGLFANHLSCCHRTRNRAKYFKGKRIVVAPWHSRESSNKARGVLTRYYRISWYNALSAVSRWATLQWHFSHVY